MIAEFITTLFDLDDIPWDQPAVAADGGVVVLAQARGGGMPARPVTRRLLERAQGELYVAVATVRPEAVERKRGGGVRVSRRAEHFSAGWVIVLDDVGTKVDRERVQVEPHYRLETSPGNEQWGYLIEPVTDRRVFVAAMRALADAGLTDAGGINAVRLVRVPGSVNMKGDTPWEARLLSWEPDRPVWELRALVEALGVPWSAVEEGARQVRAGRSAGAGATEGTGADTGEVDDPVLEWLTQHGLVRERGDATPPWVPIRCPWAEQHTGGGDTAGYLPLGAGEGDMRVRRAFHCFHEHCQARGTDDFLEWVEEAGGPKAQAFDPVPVLGREFAVIERHDRQGALLAAIRQPWRQWTASQFSAAWPGTVRKMQVGTAMIRAPRHLVPRAEGLLFRPDREPGIIEVDGVRYLNLWTGLPIREWDGELPDGAGERVEEHLRFLLPVEAEREWFWRWLAWVVRHPGERGLAVLMVADQVYGIGRSWLAALIEEVYQHYFRRVSLEAMLGIGASGQYTDWVSGTLFVVAEETRDWISDPRMAWRAYERLKEVIDTRAVRVEVNPKYGRKRVETLYANVLMFSNHADALVIDGSERRLAVLSNPDAPREPEYYEWLHAIDMRAEAAALVRMLDRIDLSGFNARVAPMTAAKECMVALSISNTDDVVELTLSAIPEQVRYCTAEQLVRLGKVVAAQEKIQWEDNMARALRKRWRRLAARFGWRDGAHYGRKVSWQGRRVHVAPLREPEVDDDIREHLGKMERFIKDPRPLTGV